MKLSLIIPAYNEEDRLPPFLESIVDFTQKNPSLIYEVIVVDDGSSDQTIQSAQKFSGQLPGFRVIPHTQNKGKGAAVQTGVMAAQGEAIVFMDADGATPITELPKMVEALGGADVAVGNRWMPGAKMERHSFLRYLSGLVYRSYMGVFGLGSIDTMCGFKGYKRDTARSLFKDLQENRWLFDTEVAYKAVHRKMNIKNFPIEWESKDGSKLDALTLLKSGLQIFPLILKIRKSAPLRQRADGGRNQN